MEERRRLDLYQKAERQLSSVAAAIQRQSGLDLAALSELAVGIADAVNGDDQLVVQAMAGPAGSPVVTNLINVSILATKVGAGLGYYGNELQRLTLAGLVHDIGLFAVPQSIVAKSGKLSKDERTLIEQHPELAYQLVKKAGAKWEWLADIVRQAHERWNGAGYPNRLKGRQISEFAQIIGVVDVFDALVTPRSYRRRFFPHEAVRELMVAERAAFPREVIKALLETLSAYPLGTLVRLSTGEKGSVVGINPRYPLRPNVEIHGMQGQEARFLNLSKLPLVSIIETLESPDMARVTFAPKTADERRTKSGLTVSDQFSSLLESLDALASAIQGVVVLRSGSEDVAGDHSDQTGQAGGIQPAGGDQGDAAFQKEVIGLFALEAHEWLGQIHSALRHLNDGANGTMRPKLYGIMLNGLTNLAKSAATVHLPWIEDMASSLLPVLHDVGRPEPKAMASALSSLQAGLDRIAAAVKQAADSPATAMPPVPAFIPIVEPPPEPAPTPVPSYFQVVEPEPVSSPATVSSIPETASSGISLLNALRELQDVRSRSMQPTRDVLEAVIQRAERKPGDLTVSGVRAILEELNQVDEDFLAEVRRRVPRMSQILSRLRDEGASDFVTASQLDPVVEEVEALHDVASRVQAGMITMFLQGLRSFLLVAAYRKTASLSQRLETVDGRVQALVPMAEQWVNIGRVERAAIADILPAP